MINVMFVCLGNICRSPTAHGVFETLVKQQGWGQQIQCYSSGTSAWHIGEAPDLRATQAAAQSGYQLDHLRAEQINNSTDFAKLDYILAMDNQNLTALQAMVPADFSGHLSLFLDYHPKASMREVPDPYFGGEQGFDQVLNLIETASNNLLAEIIKTHQLSHR